MFKTETNLAKRNQPFEKINLETGQTYQVDPPKQKLEMEKGRGQPDETSKHIITI